MLPDVYLSKHLSDHKDWSFRAHRDHRAFLHGNSQSALRRFGVNTLIENDMI